MRTLYGLLQSPWTEKARWALDHHTVAYRYHEHVPVLGEVFLRIKARSRPRGTKASVPLLVDGDTVLPSSLAIARHAEALGRGEPLFPKGEDDEVVRWADVSDRIISAGRVRVLRGLRSDAAAQREALPSFIPGALRGIMRPMAATASMFLGSKHGVDDGAERELRPALDEVRKALGGRPHIIDRFTFADLAVAASLQALRPRKKAPLGPATRAIWENAEVAADYDDLLTWRDKIYAKYRTGG